MSAYVSPTNWATIKTTLLASDGSDIVIDDENAELIIALLQMAENHNPDISSRMPELADKLKLSSLREPGSLEQLNAELVNIAQAIDAPSKFISVTEQNVKWWRTFTTYLFGAGVAIAVINAFVPIQFGLIAQTVFATGLQAAQVFFRAFSGTSGPATAAAATEAVAAAATAAATAAAAGTGPSMVAGPDLGAIGSLLYTSAVVALRTCAGAVVRVASTVASGACQLMTMPNAEKVADLAVQAATVAVITAGIDKGLDWVVKFYRGDFDAAMALAIDQGIFNAVEYAASNATIEAAYDIVAANATLGIKMSVQPAWSKLFIPPNRFLDVNIMDIIKGNLTGFLEILSEKEWLGTNADIIEELSDLDGEPPDPAAITRLKPKYGMGILILYMLLSQKSKPAKSGFGYNPRIPNTSHGSSSLPDTDMVGSKKMVEMPSSSTSMSANYKEPVGPNPYIVAYNLKKQLLRVTGYIKEDERQFVYIDEFQGTMGPCAYQVLGRLYNESRPSQGNIFTAISRRKLTQAEQKVIFIFIMSQCVRPILPPVEEEIEYEEHIKSTAAEVRAMMGPLSSMGSAVMTAGPFAEIGNTPAAFPGKASHNVFRINPRKVGSQEAVPQEVGVLGKGKGRLDPPSDFKPIKQIIVNLNKGGRKSRQHKKRKSTLKRRRIRRRRLTRKGRKRRYTKRR